MKRLSACLLALVCTVAILAAGGCGSGDGKTGTVPEKGKPAQPPEKTKTPGDVKPPKDTKPDLPGKPIPPEEKALKVKNEPFGKLADGTEVDLYTLTNTSGLKVKVMTYGCTITAIETLDRNGKRANITLYRDTLDDYLAQRAYFGCAVGRYANRIAKGRFAIDGVEYKLAINNGPNHLHGGKRGFDKYVWKAEPIEAGAVVGVKFSHESPDGDEGYPGKLAVTVTYVLTDKNELIFQYEATTDKPTPINLTNHAYWNLAGAGSGDVLGHELVLNADQFLPVDHGLIPLGPPQAVKDTPMDFTQPQTIGARIDQVEGGYDHCYILNRKPSEQMAFCARVVEPKSGRVLEIYTTQPSVQFYTGNFLDGTITADGGKIAYEKHYGFCLETGHYPDSPNRPEYPSTLLKPGETYKHVTVHKFSVQ